MENVFEKKESRADLQYYPKAKDLKDAMYMPDFSNAEERQMFSEVLGRYEA